MTAEENDDRKTPNVLLPNMKGHLNSHKSISRDLIIQMNDERTQLKQM